MIFDALWTSIFLQISRSAETSCFATSITPKPCFYFSGPPVFAYKFHRKVVLFLEPLPVLVFSHFMLIFCENDNFYDPSKIQCGAKWEDKSMKIMCEG